MGMCASVPKQGRTASNYSIKSSEKASFVRCSWQQQKDATGATVYRPSSQNRSSSVSPVSSLRKGMYARNVSPIKESLGRATLPAIFTNPVLFSDLIVDKSFKLVRTIGKGGFGRVVLARFNKDKLYYAIKIIEKKQVCKNLSMHHIRNEIRCLAKLGQHPFIVRMFGGFQDEHNIYILLSLCAGGELFHRLNILDRFPDSVAKFYAIEIGLALNFIHGYGIAFRDLKPENILLDAGGHIQLVDFGLSTFEREVMDNDDEDVSKSKNNRNLGRFNRRDRKMRNSEEKEQSSYMTSSGNKNSRKEVGERNSKEGVVNRNEDVCDAESIPDKYSEAIHALSSGNIRFDQLGSTNYMAPEIIKLRRFRFNQSLKKKKKKKPLKEDRPGKEVDWWAFGCVCYEMLMGNAPFGDSNISNAKKQQVEMKIMSGVFKIDKKVDQNAKKLIIGCLNSDIELRFDWRKIRKCKWFQNIDFAEFMDRKIPAPFIPNTRKKGRLHCFLQWPKLDKNIVPNTGDLELEGQNAKDYSDIVVNNIIVDNVSQS